MSLPRFALLASVILAMAAGAAAPVSAQQRYDNRYDRYDRYDNDNDSSSQRGGRDVAGQFDYYALVLSWSPTHCATLQRDDYEPQCHRRDGRRYNFVLHGLWPQYERGFPGECEIGRRPFVPEDVIDSAMDVMPSRQLVIHEYRKHGTCSGLDPARYFETAERLFRTIKIPARYVNPFEDQNVSPETIIGEFLAENPQLKRDMIAVSCGRRDRLQDVRICMTPNGEPRSCGKNENQRRLCSASSMYVPPVRSSGIARTDGPGSNRNSEPRQSGDGSRTTGSNSGNDGQKYNDRRYDPNLLPGPR